MQIFWTKWPLAQKDKFFSEIQSKIAKILTAYFCDLNDFENSKKKSYILPQWCGNTVFSFRIGPILFRIGAIFFNRFPDHTNFAPDHPDHHFFAPGSTSVWIFPHDWGRMYENLFSSNFSIRTNLHFKFLYFLTLFLGKKDIVSISTSSYGCYSKLISVVSNG